MKKLTLAVIALGFMGVLSTPSYAASWVKTYSNWNFAVEYCTWKKGNATYRNSGLFGCPYPG
ncbi:hypothetical protein HZU77_001650 [Neisseriaceae bacterium TC5R-5]|nr:hypothetical protein [Neisseriaceae bacterium TC5R-5]